MLQALFVKIDNLFSSNTKSNTKIMLLIAKFNFIQITKFFVSS